MTRTMIYAGGMFAGTLALVQWFNGIRLPGPVEDILRVVVVGAAGFGIGMMGVVIHKVGSLNLHESTEKLGASLRMIAVSFFGYSLYVAFDLIGRTIHHDPLSWRTPVSFTVIAMGLYGLTRLNKYITPIVRKARETDAVVKIAPMDISKPGPDIDLESIP